MTGNRYYTYFKFFSVLLMLFLAIFSTISIVYSYYRVENKKNNKITFIMLLIIIILSTSKIIENVILDIKIAEFFRNIQAVFLIIFIFLMSYYVFVKKNRLIKIKNIGKQISSIIFFLFCIYLVRYSILLELYRFENMFYSRFYSFLIFTNIILNIYFILKISNSSIQINKNYDNKRIILIITVFMVIPLLIYIIAVITASYYVDFVEIAIWYTFYIFLNLSMYLFDETGLYFGGFDKIGDMISEYIFVIDVKGDIIYNNKSVRDSSFFIKRGKVDINNTTKIFDGDVSVKFDYLGKDYLLLKKDELKHYLTYKKSELRERGELLGYIITITEVTELIELLFELEDKKKKSKTTNSQLKNYSKIVYYIEKEKEINTLLQEIIDSREDQMKQLSEMIVEIKEKIDDPLFEKQIDVAISKSNEILHDIRNTVSTYRERFGG